jgi:hypothetical protein
VMNASASPPSVGKAKYHSQVGDADYRGNFYTNPGTTEVPGRLDLDALPNNHPLVECGSACPCSTGCSNRVTQRGLKYVTST